MKPTTALFLLFSFFMLSYGQEIEIGSGVVGTWKESTEQIPPTYSWQAHWIWMQADVASDVMLARRSFQLDGLPEHAHIRITASSQYQLYINGEYVCRGPTRSAPHHQSFDILSISDLLRKGENILSVRVHHQREKHSYHLKGRAGLLAQLEIVVNGDTSSIITDAGWKVSPDPAWDNEAPKISRFQLVVNDRVDLRNQLKGWKDPGFDDSNWHEATALMRNVGWPSPQKNAKPQALTPPWTSLVPRDIPYLLETEVPAAKLIEAIQITGKPFPIALSGKLDEQIANGLSSYQQKSGPLRIPASDSSQAWLLLFDLGEALNGMPQLEIEGSAGTEVEILSAPFMVGNQFTHKVVDSEFRDRIILSGKRDKWEATYFKPVRFLGIVIHNGKEPVKLHAAGIRNRVYPFEKKGNIRSTDAPWIAQYMEASAKTIQVCTTDGYTDNYRERRQYAQTGFYAALGNYWIFGDHALQRRYLIQVAQEQEPNGMMPAYAPLAKDDYMIIMDSNCLWIRSLRNYFLYSGDRKTVKELLPAARKLMDLLHSYTHPLGFIYNPPYPYWLDHARNDRRGANVCLNGHYLGALEDFAQVLAWLDEGDSDVFLTRAALLRQSLRTHAWDEEHQLFADAWIAGERSDQFSEHANAMALAMNIATEEQAQAIAKQLLAPDRQHFIKRTSGMTVVTPAMSYFLHKGLCNYGYTDDSFDLLRERFDQMLAPDKNGTLWEEWWLDHTGRSGALQPKSRSDAQTESAFPPALFAEYLLGVVPVEPGFKKVKLMYSPTRIKQLEGNIPTPEGNLQVTWEWGQASKKSLQLIIPGDMKVQLHLPAGQPILINKQRYDIQKGPTPLLSRGTYQITF